MPPSPPSRRLMLLTSLVAVVLALATVGPLLLTGAALRTDDRLLLGVDPLTAQTIGAVKRLERSRAEAEEYARTGSAGDLEEYRQGRARLALGWPEAERAAARAGGASAERLKALRAEVEGWLARVGDPPARAVASDAPVLAAAVALEAELDRLRQAQARSRARLVRAVDLMPLVLAPLGLLALALLAGLLRTGLGLQSEADHLAELNRGKDEFLSVVGHEIRTPVTVIKLVADALRRHQRLEGASSDPWVDHRLEAIERHANRVARLVDQLLELGRGAPGLVLHRERVEVVALTRQAVEQLQRSAPRHPLRFQTRLGRAEARVDPARLEQVLFHLVGNAVRYSPEPAEVVVRLEREGRSLRWTVVDHGLGVPLREQGRLFERFYRASNAEAQHLEGLGLGLHLCRAIVEAHGGRIGFESRPGRGSVFTFTLPERVEEREEAPEEAEAAQPLG